jgi:caffeoyl-CoA O-methyltransferase
MNFIDEAIDQYCVEHSENEHPIFKKLYERTYAEMEIPQMLAGNLVGNFIQLMIRLSGAKRMIEVGTFTGYSSLKMAQALPEDGEVITLEYEAKHADFAQAFFDESPWGHKITMKRGAALDHLPLVQGPMDLGFIDADKVNYIAYYEALLKILRPGGMIILDNALWSGSVLQPEEESAKALAQMNDHVHKDARVHHMLLPLRDGLMLAIKK